MKKSHVAGQAPENPTPAQMKEFYSLVDKKRITKMNLQIYLRNPERESLFHMDDDEQKEMWKKFGNKLGLKFNMSGSIPPDRNDFTWIQPPLIKGLGKHGYFQICKEIMPEVWEFTEPRLSDVPDKRSPLEPPQDKWIRMRAGWRSDEFWKSFGYNMLVEKHLDKKFLCLSRTLLQHAFVYWVESKPLDTQTITLCAGSRGSDGSVPGIRWHFGGFNVYHYHPDDASDSLRAREAVV